MAEDWKNTETDRTKTSFVAPVELVVLFVA